VPHGVPVGQFSGPFSAIRKTRAGHPDNTAWAGTITNDVTISGSNFTQGIAVGFENGSGPVPVVSNVNVLNSTTIVMTVTLKNGGGGSNAGDSTWDLRVGPAVLPRGFTVLR